MTTYVEGDQLEIWVPSGGRSVVDVVEVTHDGYVGDAVYSNAVHRFTDEHVIIFLGR